MASRRNATAIENCDNDVDKLDVGAGANPVLRVYSAGSGVPANVEVALTDQVLLAELAMSNPAFGGAVDDDPGALATANAISDDTAADASGDPAFVRMFDKNDVAQLQYTAGGPGSGMEVEFNVATFTAGLVVRVTELTHFVPE